MEFHAVEGVEMSWGESGEGGREEWRATNQVVEPCLARPASRGHCCFAPAAFPPTTASVRSQRLSARLLDLHLYLTHTLLFSCCCTTHVLASLLLCYIWLCHGVCV